MSTMTPNHPPRHHRPAAEVDIDRVVAEVERRLATQPAGSLDSRDGLLRRQLRRVIASQRRRRPIP